MTPTKLATPLALGLAALISLAITPARAQTVKAACTDSSRACLLRTTRIYIEGLGRHDPSRIPFAPKVRCTEQGRIPVTDEKTFRSEIAGSTLITGVRNVRLFADPQTSEVGAFFLIDVAGETKDGKTTPPYSVRRGERFKIVGGLVTEVEAINYIDPALPGLAPKLWPD